MKPMYNALAAKGVMPNQPATTSAPTPSQAAKPVKPATKAAVPGFNAKPDKNANAGQSPSMMGDKQKIKAPASPSIGSTAVPRASGDVRSGMEVAMGQMADKMHPRKGP